MFGIGLPELAVILMMSAILFGPDKLPDYARQAAHTIRTLRRIMKTTQEDLRGELGPEFGDLELRDLDPRTLIRKHILESDVELPHPGPEAAPSAPIETEHTRAPDTP